MFFKRNNKHFVKLNSGGFAHEKVKNHKNVVKTRVDFATRSRFAKDFKMNLLAYMPGYIDGRFHNVVMSWVSTLQRIDPRLGFSALLGSAEVYAKLRGVEITQFSCLYPNCARYDRLQNVITVGGVVGNSKVKLSPRDVLEVRFGWLHFLPNGSIQASDITCFQVGFEQGNYLQKTVFDVAPAPVVTEGCVLPILGLRIAYVSNNGSVPNHAYKYHAVMVG